MFYRDIANQEEEYDPENDNFALFAEGDGSVRPKVATILGGLVRYVPDGYIIANGPRTNIDGREQV